MADGDITKVIGNDEKEKAQKTWSTQCLRTDGRSDSPFVQKSESKSKGWSFFCSAL